MTESSHLWGVGRWSASIAVPQIVDSMSSPAKAGVSRATKLKFSSGNLI